MEKEFSLQELQTIQSLTKEMSIVEIADFIGRPLQEVNTYMKKFRIINGGGKKENRAKKVAARKKEMSAENKIPYKGKSIKNEFATLNRDFSKMKAVRLDKKTIIYLNRSVIE